MLARVKTAGQALIVWLVPAILLVNMCSTAPIPLAIVIPPILRIMKSFLNASLQVCVRTIINFFQDPFIYPLIGNVTSMQCRNVSFTDHSGQCDFQSWAMDSGNKPPGFHAEVFYCSFYGCKAALIPNGIENGVLYNF